MYRCLGPRMIGIEQPFPDAAALASRYGFEGIQVDLEYLLTNGADDYRSILDEHNLQSGSIGLPFRIDATQEEYEEGIERLPDVAMTVAEIGCSRASTYIMSFSDERNFDENFAFHKQRLQPVAEILADDEISLALEFLGPETIREGYAYDFIHTASGMLDLCDAVGDNVGLLLDSWHWYTSGDDAETLRSLTREDVVDVHINDAPDRPREEQIDNERALPGATGVIDIATFLQELNRMGYDGPITAEPFSDELAAMEDEKAVTSIQSAFDDAWESAGL